jgi:hypothetical protein
MSNNQSKFNDELDKLYRIKTDNLRHLLGPARKGKSPTFDRDLLDRTIKRLQEVASKALVRRFHQEEFSRRVMMKKRWFLTTGKGFNLDAKRENFKKWYEKKFQRHKCSVYVFWTGRKCVYVGKTEKGPDRIISHIYSKRFGNPTRIDVYLTHGKRDLPILECLAIHRFNPKINQMGASKKKFAAKCPLCKCRRQIKKELRRMFAQKKRTRARHKTKK